jgi:very-short-patch-repair endonuclease
MTTTEALLAFGRRHRWVVTTQQLRNRGFDSAAIGRHRRAGVLTPMFRAVWLVGRVRPTRQEWERGALLTAGERSALGRGTAGAIFGLCPERWPLEVWTPTRRRSQPRLRVHFDALDERDVTVRGGRRVTTVARTLSDLAVVHAKRPAEVERLVHEAEYRGLLRPAQVEAASHRAGPRPGQRLLLEAVARRTRRQGKRVNDLHDRVRHELQRRDLPPFEVEVPFELDDGERFTVDVLFRDAWYALEVDGGGHKTHRSFTEDRRRDRRLLAVHALPVGRVTDHDLDTRIDEWAEDLRTILVSRKVRGTHLP